MPTKVLAIELSKPLQAVSWENKYDSLKILVSVKNKPLKWIDFYGLKRNGIIKPNQILEEIQKKAGWQLVINHITTSNTPWFASKIPQRYSVPISIIICIENDVKQLEACLSALFSNNYQNLEVIVVDIVPLSDLVSNLISGFPVKYVSENKKGLNNARNRGIKEASHDIVGFIDPDTIVSNHWCNTIAETLANLEVIGVSGYTAPLELETLYQRAFEANYKDIGFGLDSSIIRKLGFDVKKMTWVTGLGLRNNIAFRKDAFTNLGFFNISFDEKFSRLGIADMVERVLASGFAIASEPSMLVWNNNQNDTKTIRRTVFDFSKFFWCYAVRCLLSKEMKKRVLVSFMLKNWLLKRNILNLFRIYGGVPKRFTIEELKGAASCLFNFKAIVRRVEKSKEVQSKP